MKLFIRSLIVVILTVSCIFASSVPQIITFQGRLTSGGAPVKGSKSMRFAIVDNNNNVVWQNHSSASISVPVNNGVYTVKLGDTSISDMAPILLDNIDQGLTLNIRVWVEGEQLVPDITLGSVPYSMLAKQAETITANVIAGNSIIAALGHSSDTLTIPNTADIKNLMIDGVSVSSTNNVLIFIY